MLHVQHIDEPQKICTAMNEHLYIKNNLFLLNKLLCFEEPPQVQDLPCSQSQQTQHGENAEVQNSRVCRF